MAERSGIGAQIGFATEETYGTYKAPSRFLPFESESLELTKNYSKYRGLVAGRFVQRNNLHRATTRTAAGDVQIPFLNIGMGILLNQLHGNSVSPEKIGSTTAYKQVHAIGLVSPYGKSLTCQVGRPDTGGTVRPFSYLGCKVVSMRISVEANGIAMVTLTLDGQDEVTGEALGSPTYSTTAVPFTFQQMEAKVGSEKIGNVRSITFDIPIPQSTERYHLGNSGKKDQPILNEYADITASAVLEFAGLGDHTRFKEEESVKLSLIGEGATIQESNKFKASLVAPSVKQTSSGPTVQGPDIITTDVSFEVTDNGSEAPLTAELVSTDSAL